MAAAWPTRQELQQAVEERSLEALGTLEEGVEGLCRRLGADPHDGLPEGVPDHALRQEAFGSARCAERRQKAYYEYVWEAVQDKILLLLLGIGTLELVVKMVLCPEEREEAWVEPLAIYVTVAIVVGVQSAMDYKRARLFDSLSRKVAASNMRFVVRGGRQVSLPDGEIVVGDIVAFNSHLAASVPADGVLLSGEGVRADESALTGEPDAIQKDAASPFILSGTTIVAGQGRMLVVAVGADSVAGKIKKAVYSEEDVQSPLFEKLDRMANSIGRVGTTVAALVFAAACVQGFAVRHQPAHAVIDYLLLSLGVLAVAVPEGLPLALTISLAISSNRMSYQSNLVKTLDSCETMGSVTTICTDKTGTLTANRMAVGAAYLGGVLLAPDGGGKPVGRRLREAAGLSDGVKALVGNLVSVCSMDESHLGQEGAELRFHGNPTECAMLQMVQDCGFSYAEIRQATAGRSASSRQHGSVNGFTSGRKLMSWAVPKPGGGGYRVYAKGASEIVLGRVTSAVGADGAVWPLPAAERDRVAREVVEPFAQMAYRTVGLAFRDMEEAPGDALHESLLNADGSRALACETGLTLVGVLFISDPLRPEVPRAISQCYSAGIDVRMVTGDALPTAVAIAKEAGILDTALHCHPNGEPKPFCAMEGKSFRQHVHTRDDKGDLVFSQERFDDIWPHLRVLARSSPEDKLTLAKGLRASRLFLEASRVRRLRQEDGITIFPDVQVVAMTGDGTNDAPALKAADVGFAMGIAGTQIAKDAANIVLMDDNFASIVTAAKWGRNVFDCVQKFLQFQLTVNIAVLVVLSVVCFAGIPSPLNLLHLLWLNMIMDSLASVALASEPPTDRLLARPPVNRSASIITPRMWYNMLGQALYQVLVILAVLFSRASLPFLRDPEDGIGLQSKQYTVIFNVFVLMQLSNEYNARCLEGEWNVFKGVRANPTFLAVSASTLLLQGLMAQFGGKALHLHPDGLDTTEWAFCLFLGAGPILWQFFLNVAQRSAAVLADRLGIRAHKGAPVCKLRSSLKKADEESEAQSEATMEQAAGQKGLPAFMV